MLSNRQAGSQLIPLGDENMSKQVQDAYVVAATRTPIGKSGRGAFQEHAARRDARSVTIKNAPAQSRRSGDNEDAIVGCAMPEGEGKA